MNKIKSYLKSTGMKSILVLSGGLLISQFLNFLLQPIATRIYTVESFGYLSLIISWSNTLMPLMTLQYHMPIVSEKSEKEVNKLVTLNFLIVFIMTIMIGFTLTVSRYYLHFFKDLSFFSLISIILLLLILGVGNIADSYNNRNEQYKLMSRVSIIRSVFLNSSRIFLGLINLQSIGLLFSQILGSAMGLRQQLKYVIENFNLFKSIKKTDIRYLICKFKYQPLYSLPGIFITNLSYSILPIVITNLYDIKSTGYFSLTVSVLGIPLSLLSSNIGRVFFKNASKEYADTGSYYETLKKTSVLLVVLATSGFLLLWFIAEPAFSLIYGSSWVISGTYVKVLIPMYWARFIVSSLMFGFIISGKQIAKMFLQGTFIIGSGLVAYIAFKYNLALIRYLDLINWTYFSIYVILFIFLIKDSKGD